MHTLWFRFGNFHIGGGPFAYDAAERLPHRLRRLSTLGSTSAASCLILGITVRDTSLPVCEGTARARDRQSGAVEERAQQVHPEYLRHARQLDYHPQASPPVTITPGPRVEQVSRSCSIMIASGGWS